MIISGRCTTLQRSVSELAGLGSCHSLQVLWKRFFFLWEVRWAGGRSGLTSGSWKTGSWEAGMGEYRRLLSETDKAPNTCSVELWKAGEGNLSKNRQHYCRTKKKKKKICFWHKFPLILKASKNSSDVIHQRRHTHFRKWRWKMIFPSSRNSTPSPLRHMELNTFSGVVRLSLCREQGFVCQ